MLKFLSIEIEGFRSIENLKFSLNPKQTLLIRAANGFGKSTLFSSLVWVLYGKAVNGVSDVNTWAKYRTKDNIGTRVSLYFQKDQSLYKVIRCQNYTGVIDDGAKGANRLIIYQDATLLDIKDKNKTQQKLIDIIGLSQSLFTNSIIFGQGINRLISESNSDKKKLFEEVFDLNYLNVAKDLANTERSKINSEYTSLQNDINSLQREISSVKSTYHELKSQEVDFADTLKKKLSELNKEKSDIALELEHVKSKVGESVQSAIDKLQKKIQLLRVDYNKAKTISNIPIREFINDVYAMLKNGKYQEATKSLRKLMDSYDEMDSLTDEISNSTAKLDQLRVTQSSYTKYHQKLVYLESDLEKINSSIKKLKSEKQSILSPKYKEKLKSLKSKLNILNEQLDEKKAQLSNYNWLVEDPLGNNGIKTYLFDSQLSYINSELDRYAEILGFHISFFVDLSSSRKEFKTIIERDGVTINYDELSGGEKQLVDISMAFAMNQALTRSKNVNIAFLDELFESLSSDHIELVIQLVKEVYKDKTLFIISHHSNLPFSNARIVEVEKHQGLSYYNGL